MTDSSRPAPSESHAAAAAAATPPAPTGPRPPSTRELRPPHFILRTPDGLASYFDRENYRIVMSPHEPLAAFLAPGKLVDEKTPQPGHARQRIEYDLSGYDAASFAPLEAPPASVLGAFEAAVQAFYARIDDPASKATDHEKRLRRGFRLPDPDKEKDCYWVHGPRDDRRLLVLWGCEAVRGTALPPMARADAGGGAGVLEKLKARGMPWSVLQREAVALVIDRRRPLARFLATPVRDRAGTLTAVIHQGKSIPRDKLTTLKHLGPSEISAFEREAAEFYAGAQNGSQGVTAYEKELRRALRLPDPDKRSGQYFLLCGRLVIVILGDETQDTVLCPTSDAGIPLPPEETGPDGAKFVPETIVDRLKRRATPTRKRLILAGVGAVIVVAALIALEIFADRSAPRVVGVSSQNDPTSITVAFDEKIDERSIESTAEVPEPVRLRAPTGRYVPVVGVRLDPADARRLLVQVEPIGEGSHAIVLKGIRDTSRKHNTIAADTVKEFEFEDTLSPELQAVSAHHEDASKLVLVFNEPIDPRSLRDRGNYEVPGFTLRSAEAGREASQVVLTVDKPFQNRERYSISIQGLTDQAQNGLPGTIQRDFQYLDTIPPVLERVEAAASQVKVHLTFTKKLGPDAADPSLYTVETKPAEDGWAAVEVRGARVPDATKPVVELVTSPLRNGVAYRVTARDVPDAADPVNRMAPAEPMEFRFTGREDKTPPGLGRPRMREGTNNREIEITFPEEVTSESATRPESYSLVENSTPVIDASSADGAMVRTAVLRTAGPLPQGSRLTLRCTGLTDLVGNTNAEAVSEQFWVTGVGMIEDMTLRCVSAEVHSPTSVTLVFNEDLTQASATATGNFSLAGGRRISRAEWSAAKPKQVTLHLDGSTPLTPGSHAITVRNLVLAELSDQIQHEVVQAISVR